MKFLIRTCFCYGTETLRIKLLAWTRNSKVSYVNSVSATTGGLALTYKTKHYDFNGDFICDTQFYMIYMNWLNHVLCDYVTDSLCSLYMWVAMCMQFYDFMWFMILSTWYMIMFYNTYMNRYYVQPNPVTYMWISVIRYNTTCKYLTTWARVSE